MLRSSRVRRGSAALSSINRASEVNTEFSALVAAGELDASPRDLLEELLIERMPVGAESVLDLGCGTGSLAIRVASEGHRVWGIDICDETVKEARRRAESAGATNATFLTLDAARLSEHFGPGAFDCIISVNALHHFFTREVAEAIETCLRPGGQFIEVDTVNDYCIGLRGYFATLVLYDVLHPWWILSFVRRRGFRRVVRFYHQLQGMLRNRRWREHIQGEVRRRNVYSLPRYRAVFEALFPGGTVARVFSYAVLAIYRRPPDE